MKEQLFYLYADVSDCGNVFYVGKATKLRAYGLKRNKKHGYIAVKHGQNRKVICCSHDEWEIFDLERTLIADLKLNCYRNPDNKWACNFTDGGEGVAGTKWPDERRVTVGNGLKGHKHPQSTKDAIGQAHKGKDIPQEMRDRIAATLKGNIPWNKGLKGEANPQTGKKRGTYKTNGNLGRKNTPAARERMKLAWQKRREREKSDG